MGLLAGGGEFGLVRQLEIEWYMKRTNQKGEKRDEISKSDRERNKEVILMTTTFVNEFDMAIKVYDINEPMTLF